jgi:hypothetical protein
MKIKGQKGLRRSVIIITIDWWPRASNLRSQWYETEPLVVISELVVSLFSRRWRHSGTATLGLSSAESVRQSVSQSVIGLYA